MRLHGMDPSFSQRSVECLKIATADRGSRYMM
jgi:hypothetical protein